MDSHFDPGIAMRFRSMFLSIMILAFAADARAEGAQVFWIVADVAPILSQPKPRAELVANARTGHSFLGVKRSGGWIYIDSVNSQPVHGWVQDSLVSEMKVDSAYLVARIRQAKNFADSLKWCERVVSLLPMNREYLNALQKGYTAFGDTAKAAFYGRELRGTNPIYLAHKEGKDLLVIGSLDSTGDFHKLLWIESIEDQANQSIKKKAKKLLMRLSSLDWYPTGMWIDFPESPVHLSTIPKTKKSIGFMGVYENPMGEDTYGISLGSFYDDVKQDGESFLFATRPNYPVPFSGMTRQSELDSLPWYRKKLVGSAFDSGGMTQAGFKKLHEYGYVELIIGGILPDGRRAAEQRGIFDPQRKLVWPPEGTTGSDFWLKPLDPKPAPRWFRFGMDPRFPAYIVLPLTSNLSPPDFKEDMGNFGYNLLEISKSGMRIFEIRSDYSGD